MIVLLTFCYMGGKIKQCSEKACAVFNLIHIILLFLQNPKHFNGNLRGCQ